jgi:hypothetical protein
MHRPAFHRMPVEIPFLLDPIPHRTGFKSTVGPWHDGKEEDEEGASSFSAEFYVSSREMSNMVARSSNFCWTMLIQVVCELSQFCWAAPADSADARTPLR